MVVWPPEAAWCRAVRPSSLLALLTLTPGSPLTPPQVDNAVRPRHARFPASHAATECSTGTIPPSAEPDGLLRDVGM